MPLIPCPECSHQVSTEAHACPHCGFPFPARAAAPPAADGTAWQPRVPPPAPVTARAPRPVGTRPERSAAKGPLAIIGVVVLAVVTVLAVSANTEYPSPAGGEQLADSLFADSLLTAIGVGGDGSESAYEAPIEPDAWVQGEYLTEMDGTRAVYVSTSADQDVRGWLDAVTRPMLYIRCQEGKTELFVRTELPPNVEYGMIDQATVRVRVDEESPSRQVWGESLDGKALFAPKPIALARRLAAASSFRFEFTPFQSNPQTVTFQVAGLENHLGAVAGACGWSFTPPEREPPPANPRATPQS